MRGFSFIFGGYPCEIDLIKWINGGSKVSLHWSFIVYITVFVLLAVLSFMFQLRNYRQKHPIGEEDDFVPA
jgi:hypothetical protein